MLNQRSRKTKTLHAFTLVELLVVIAIIGLLVGLLLSAIQAARESARRAQCQSNEKNIALACLNYESSHNRLPPGATLNRVAKRNGLSWHVQLLPYMENDNLHEEIFRQINDFRRTDPAHQPQNIYDFKDINEVAVSPFRCPSDSEVVDNRNGELLASSSYAGITGSAASRNDSEMFVGDNSGLCGVVNFDGVLFPASRTRLRQIEDGTTHTLLLGERWYQLRAWTAGVFWLEPGNSRPPTGPAPNSCLSSLKNINATLPVNASLAQVGYYKGHEPDDRPGEPTNDQKTLTYNDLPFGSFHPGGAHFALADGSIHFISDDIEPTLLAALASKAGAEIAELK